MEENINMKTKWYIQRWFIGMAVLVLAALLLTMLVSLFSPLGWSPARADPHAVTVNLSPSPALIQGCETITVEIMINDVTNLYGADVRLTFDPAILSVDDAYPAQSGINLAHGNILKPPYYVVYNTADNTHGTIKYALTQLYPTPPFSGSGVLARIRFKARSAGTTAVTFSSIQLGDNNGIEIPASGSSGTVQPAAPAAPTLTISKLNASDARLSWTAVAGVSGYQLYRDTTPYFTPSVAYQATSSLSYDDLGVLGNPATNYFYTLKATCPNGFLSQASNRVGEFDFELLRNATNAIALPLIDSSLQFADDLGLATASIKVSRWVSATQSFDPRLVGVTGKNFNLQTGHGYFIRTSSASSPTVFTTVGGVPDAGSVSFGIARGVGTCKLNLISLPLDHPELTNADMLANDIGGVPKISRWVAATGSFDPRLVGVVGKNFPTLIGYPYWPCANTGGGGAYWP